MFRNYLKLAWRNLSRQKAFSIINITGLAVGLASSLTILLWVQDELSYDRFHSKAERTYRVIAAASNLEVAISPSPLGPALQETLPGIEQTTRLYASQRLLLQTGEKKFEERGAFYAEPSLFDVFDFKLEHGDVKTCLVDPKSIVISENIALKYFGTTDVIGKTFRINNDDDFRVTGVLAKATGNSHLKLEILLAWSNLAQWYYNVKNSSWDNFDFYTYVVFDDRKNEAAIADLLTKIDQLYRDHDKNVQITFGLQPMTDIHLHSNLMGDVAGNGNFQYVAALGIIAVFILLIGCINFMNLSTARSARRAKEVGLRKVAGAVRTQLVRQFLGESLLITVLSLAIALIIVAITLPVVNDLVGKQLQINFTDPLIVASIAGIAIITGILAGIYPAVVLSGFTPVKVLKKDVKGGAGGSLFRNVLVVTQFAISIVLLVGTSVVYQQLQYMRAKDIGYDKSNLLYTSIPSEAHKKIVKWRTAFQSNELTEKITFSSDRPTNLVSGAADVQWPGKDPNKQVMFVGMFVDDNFVPVYDMEIVSGRNFNKELRGDSSSYMINETAAAVMGFTPETAIGQTIKTWDRSGPIVGVIKDFNFKPLREAIEPMILRPNTWGGTIVIKVEAGKLKETIAAMETTWSSLEDLHPFSFGFIDQDLENLYQSEKQVGTLFTAFALLAILISCLGLYGLSAYIAEQRTREIGIRKALGASILSIIYLLNTRFVVPILISVMIAAPLAWYAMNRWLDSFAYKINFSWGIVAVAGAMALLISLITVSYESVKAAKVNPVKSLRSE